MNLGTPTKLPLPSCISTEDQDHTCKAARESGVFISQGAGWDGTEGGREGGTEREERGFLRIRVEVRMHAFRGFRGLYSKLSNSFSCVPQRTESSSDLIKVLKQPPHGVLELLLEWPKTEGIVILRCQCVCKAWREIFTEGGDERYPLSPTPFSHPACTQTLSAPQAASQPHQRASHLPPTNPSSLPLPLSAGGFRSALASSPSLAPPPAHCCFTARGRPPPKETRPVQDLRSGTGMGSTARETRLWRVIRQTGVGTQLSSKLLFQRSIGLSTRLTGTTEMPSTSDALIPHP